MSQYDRIACLICGSRRRRPVVWMAEAGIPHGDEGHELVYSAAVISCCESCGHGQLERYSHDCFSFYQDEDWDMYWWYALDPTTVTDLRQQLAGCPDPANGRCDCPVHTAWRTDCRALYGGVRYAIAPNQAADFAWLTVEAAADGPHLRIDAAKGTAAAA
jgi:hypothetical protein